MSPCRRWPAQVLWMQAVLIDNAGGKHWARAVAYQASDLPPVERKAAVLAHQFDRHPERTIQLHSAAKVRAFKGASEFLLQDFMELEALETARADQRGGQFHLFLGTYKFTTNENGKVQPLFPQAQALLRGRNMTFITNRSGYLLQRSVPVLNPPNPPLLRLDFSELVEQMANTYEMTCLAIPNRKLQPKDTWTARVPVLLNKPLPGANQNKKEIIDLFLTCTYEGRALPSRETPRGYQLDRDGEAAHARRSSPRRRPLPARSTSPSTMAISAWRK